MMLADAERVDADLVGQDPLLDDVPDDLRLVPAASRSVKGDVAERVESEPQVAHGHSSVRAG
jgi:hypothetical protein